jgi:hypothetical protein
VTDGLTHLTTFAMLVAVAVATRRQLVAIRHVALGAAVAMAAVSPLLSWRWTSGGSRYDLSTPKSASFMEAG